MRAIIAAVTILLSACTVTLLQGNCTRVTVQMEGASQVQEQCR